MKQEIHMQPLNQGHETQYSSICVSAIITKLQGHHLSFCLFGEGVSGAAKESWMIFHIEMYSLPSLPISAPKQQIND